MKINYQAILHNTLKELENNDYIPTLLLHTCCAPCSSAVIKKLASYFKITVLYYNPNIFPEKEYIKRKEEQIRFLKEFKTKYPVSFLDCDYEGVEFEKISNGLEKEKEGGKRCEKCFLLRLSKTVQYAKKMNFDYFATSLTVSPYKNAQLLNEIGKELEEKYNIKYLYSDFKKEDGYKESINLSKEYHLYRQDYCGCLFSKKEREESKNKTTSNTL